MRQEADRRLTALLMLYCMHGGCDLKVPRNWWLEFPNGKKWKEEIVDILLERDLDMGAIHGTDHIMVEKEKDIVERLREDGEYSMYWRVLMLEAADGIERSRKWIEQLQYEVKNYAAENAKLREALQFALDNSDNYHGEDWESVARAALQKDKP